MSQVVGRPETTAALLAALYGPVKAEMVEVEEMLRRELRSTGRQIEAELAGVTHQVPSTAYWTA